MPNNKIKNVIIIGSGFSYGFAHIPIQNDFWEEINNHIDEIGLSDYCKALKMNLNSSLKNEQHFNPIETENIEILFSTLHDVTYLSKNIIARQSALKLTLFYRSMIVSFLEKFQKGFIKNPIYISKNIFKNINNYNKINTAFISLNFDELFEHSISKNNKYYHYKYDDITTENSNYIISGFEILKLHGSISWLEKRKFDNSLGNFKSYRPPIFIKDNRKKVTNILDSCYLNLTQKESMNIAYTPVIIPFFFQKTQWYSQKWGEIFIPIYKRCAEVLDLCNNIKIIGYGLPEADWPILNLLSSIRNCEKKIIEIINPKESTDSSIIRYKNIFKKNIEHIEKKAEEYFDIDE